MSNIRRVRQIYLASPVPASTVQPAGGITGSAVSVPRPRRIQQQFYLPSSPAYARRSLAPVNAQYLSLTGISSAEAFGTPTITTAVTRSVTSIASAEAFGTVTIRRHPGLLRFLIATDNA